jgi:uncharacterized alpha-E superfamily protein
MGPTHAELEMPAEAAQWLAVLRFCAGSEPFFKRSAHVLSGPNVAAFLLFDHSFPRSVHHNLSRAQNFLRRIAAPAPEVGERSTTLLDGLLGWLERLTIEDVLERSIHDVLEFVVESVGEIGSAVREDFFEPGLVPVGAPSQEQKQGSEP